MKTRVSKVVMASFRGTSWMYCGTGWTGPASLMLTAEGAMADYVREVLGREGFYTKGLIWEYDNASSGGLNRLEVSIHYQAADDLLKVLQRERKNFKRIEAGVSGGVEPQKPQK